MKVAYIAGPYRGKSKIKFINYLQRQININRAAKVAKWAWKEGYAVICPHLNSRNLDGVVEDLMFLYGDQEILIRCDLMILVPGWTTSEGTREEIKFALMNDMKIFMTFIRKGNFRFYPLTKGETETLLREAESLD